MQDIHWALYGVSFACNAQKRLENARKHDIDLIRASEVFFDSLAVSNFDAEHSEHEDRHSIIGKLANEKLVYAVYVFRDDAIRLISARKATTKEAERYAQQ
jgi:uncharacterized DUF497 family protein